MLFVFGAGGRGRTDTVSLPLDFESSTSANSITPAYHKWYYIIIYKQKSIAFLKNIKKDILKNSNFKNSIPFIIILWYNIY